MKSKASELMNKIIMALTSMARGKTLALRSKTRALKARLIIFSLLSNKKFLVSSLSHKLHNVISSGHHHCRGNKLRSHDDEDGDGDSDGDGSTDNVEEEDQTVMLYRDSMAHHRVPDPTHNEPVVDNTNADGSYYVYDDGDGGDDEKYPDRTHSMFNSEDLEFEDPGGSVIDLVKNSKQEAGESFSLEEEIDHAADLFIKRFHRQMRLQKQQSFKELQEMLQRGL
ncbi:uncharacterized protein LOC116203680 [Punica granatum]|uniref:Uncharacterized protein n=2 Tax=Punica granatum TaxID=22663 RepID=A0A218W5Q7_PUNGR|nr:uncharacterized protein LOC116203680 [Punica granatum]OWM67561.1 hypothetical protein CDL15_Pgr028424 [Punica granatum]PKI79255.1 hypothetical protein CRG98_000375 [Punica granatum]